MMVLLKDIVDETITNMQSYLRRLVMGETNLKETVEQRLSSIGMNAPGELDLSETDFDRYEGDGFPGTWKFSSKTRMKIRIW